MTAHPVKRRKKLIEVAIPLEAINAACAHEKMPGIGAHPRGLHWWWARRPLAAARAVIFCQMVDDPSALQEEFPTEEAQENERLRLFAMISELVTWENTTNEEVLNRAREEIRCSWRRCCADNADHPEAAELFNPEKLPGFHDPFAGGGALPLEAQRLGLEAYASDLNPVAVLINKAMIEIPPKFVGMPPVNPDSRGKKQLIERQWRGSQGLAEDIHYYGKWIRDEAQKRIGSLYPGIKVTKQMAEDPENPRPDLLPYVGQELKVLAWLWVRTVKSPNPAFSDVDVPLASTFMLSSKAGKEAYIQPAVSNNRYKFAVRIGKPGNVELAKKGTSAGKWNAFSCLMSGTPIPYDYIRKEGCAGRMGERLMAIVAEGKRGKVYLSPTEEAEIVAISATPGWKPDLEINHHPRDIKTQIYGLTTYGQLFTNRQLVALSTFSNLIEEAKNLIRLDAENAALASESNIFEDTTLGPDSYSKSLSIYFAFCLSRLLDFGCALATWKPSGEQVMHLFTRQALPMTWDFPESNFLGDKSICWMKTLKYTSESLLACGANQYTLAGDAEQLEAQVNQRSKQKVVSTDPPYYDNIGYADLSDFFYVWLRKTLGRTFPELFTTIAVPKAGELVATPYRHGSKERADSFFLDGMSQAMTTICREAHPAFPVTIYYAFKQSETKTKGGNYSTGWETFLEAVIRSGFLISGTWPLRSEQEYRMIGIGANALASSIVLVCSKRPETANHLSRSDFRRLLRSELPKSLRELERANTAPVDLAQAAIGPGMAIFSSAKAILNPDDSPMSVREALIEINSALDEHLSKDEGDLDSDSRFALTFFESFGYAERDFGDAEGLAKARNVSVEGVAKAGILQSVGGKAWLLRREQLADDWDPTLDNRLCVWEATQQLIKRLEVGGETAAGNLLAQLKQVSGHGDLPSNCRALAYRLYNHCEKTKQAEEARSYNGLVIAWPELERQSSAASSAQSAPLQTSLI